MAFRCDWYWSKVELAHAVILRAPVAGSFPGSTQTSLCLKSTPVSRRHDVHSPRTMHQAKWQTTKAETPEL